MNETSNKKVVEINEEAKESKFKNACAKVGAGIKKHGKKIAVGAAVIATGVVLYVLKGKIENPTDKVIDDDVIDIIDVSDYADEVQSN